MCFVPAPEETYPESKAQLGDQAWRIQRFPLVVQGLFCTRHLISLRVLEADAWLVVPTRTELITESFVNLIAERDFKTLNRPVERFAEGGVPRVETESLSGVAGSDSLVALQPLR
jgi:hypothetical protein